MHNGYTKYNKFIGGSGRICAINPHTGKFLWFLKSPDLKEYGRGAFFKGGYMGHSREGRQKRQNHCQYLSKWGVY